MYVRLEAKEKFQQLLLSDVTGGKVLQRNNWLLWQQKEKKSFFT